MVLVLIRDCIFGELWYLRRHQGIKERRREEKTSADYADYADMRRRKWVWMPASPPVFAGMTGGGVLVLGVVKRDHPRITQIRGEGIKRIANGCDCLFGTDDSLRSLSVAPGIKASRKGEDEEKTAVDFADYADKRGRREENREWMRLLVRHGRLPSVAVRGTRHQGIEERRR